MPKRSIVGVVGSSSTKVGSRLDAAMLSAGVVVDGGRPSWEVKGVTHTWYHEDIKHRGGSIPGPSTTSECFPSLTMTVVPDSAGPTWRVLLWWLRPLGGRSVLSLL